MMWSPLQNENMGPLVQTLRNSQWQEHWAKHRGLLSAGPQVGHRTGGSQEASAGWVALDSTLMSSFAFCWTTTQAWPGYLSKKNCTRQGSNPLFPHSLNKNFDLCSPCKSVRVVCFLKHFENNSFCRDSALFFPASCESSPEPNPSPHLHWKGDHNLLQLLWMESFPSATSFLQMRDAGRGVLGSRGPSWPCAHSGTFSKNAWLLLAPSQEHCYNPHSIRHFSTFPF